MSVHEAAERLADSLLHEGYALFPYTPSNAKNATPTPFGIVYPPAYAGAQPAAFDHLRTECVAACPPSATVEVAVLYLSPSGTRHEAERRRVSLAPATVAELATAPLHESFGAGPEGGPRGTVHLAAEVLPGELARITATVANETALSTGEAEAMERAAALEHSLISTHVLLGIEGGRFLSPLEDEGPGAEAVQACENVNCWPVLAAPQDEALLGAAILLPDHPQLAPQSSVNMFDHTEIEEALALHVRTLSDSEREAIAAQDATVQEMIERVSSASSDELRALHAEMHPSEPGLLNGAPPAEPRFPEWGEPGLEAAEARARNPTGAPADVPGEERVEVDGRRFERGGKVVLRPGTSGDPYDKMLHGQRATVERIYLDYDGRAYVGVTVDADPMAEILRESGRYLFFFAHELEPEEEA